jgi:hypothetical protein
LRDYLSRSLGSKCIAGEYIMSHVSFSSKSFMITQQNLKGILECLMCCYATSSSKYELTNFHAAGTMDMKQSASQV